MPSAHLNTSQPQIPPISHATLAKAVESTLAGTPTEVAALEAGTTAALLAEATEVYRAAGRAALSARADDTWYHVNIQFADWATAEQTAVAHLAPRLRALTASGAVTGWWFLRKYPCWRIRFRPSESMSQFRARNEIDAVMDDLVTTGTVESWWTSLYEPETFAFGGPHAMPIIHEHFCADSLGALDYLSRADVSIGRRELSVLLCNAMFTAAGLDGFEIGDVWDKVAQLRPAADHPSPTQHRHLTTQLRQLLSMPTGPSSPLFAPDSPLSSAAPWARASDQTGRNLGASAAAGSLQRGPRHVFSHLVIFHWNRLGLQTDTQSALSLAARDSVLPSEDS